jgi:phosphotriesterase-related protein
MPDDFDRLKALVLLCDEGYSKQIVLGNDMANKFMGRSYGNYGYTRWLGFALPMLETLDRGDWIADLTINNPARILAY